jgi:hypothetical protein
MTHTLTRTACEAAFPRSSKVDKREPLALVDQGRHLVVGPPYGYRLVDAGPHPNAAHAAWGRRLRRLGMDPLTAPYVRWIDQLVTQQCRGPPGG